MGLSSEKYRKVTQVRKKRVSHWDGEIFDDEWDLDAIRFRPHVRIDTMLGNQGSFQLLTVVPHSRVFGSQPPTNRAKPTTDRLAMTRSISE